MSCSRPYTDMDKWSAAAISGLLFLLISSPYIYGGTNSLLSRIGLRVANDGGCPNITGMLLHSLVFVLLLRWILERRSSGCNKPYSGKDKWIVSLIGGVMFLLFSSPFLYDLIDQTAEIFGVQTALGGCPTLGGLVLHSLLFMLVARMLMR